MQDIKIVEFDREKFVMRAEGWGLNASPHMHCMQAQTEVHLMNAAHRTMFSMCTDVSPAASTRLSMVFVVCTVMCCLLRYTY